MKILELSSPEYNKISLLSEEFFQKKNNGTANISTLGKKRDDIVKYGEALKMDSSLFDAILSHYVVFDYGCINTIQDSSEETIALKNNVFGLFEIVDISEESVCYLHDATGEKYEIVGEGMESERRLGSLQIGDLVVARIIQKSDGWYNLKNYFYFLHPHETQRVFYKYILNTSRDILEMLERVYFIHEAQNSPQDANINYEKRIKKLFGNFLSKKLEKEINTILKDIGMNTYRQMEDFLSKPDFRMLKMNLKKEISSLISSYIQSQLNQNANSTKDEYSKRFYLVTQAFFVEVSKEFEVDQYGRIDDELQPQLQAFKNKWFLIPNPRFSHKTPQAFLQEVRSDFKIQDIQIKQLTQGEIEFYDGYTGLFSQEEYNIYEAGLEKAKKQDASGYRDFEKLMGKHGDFFRLRANYIMVRYHYLYNTYIDKKYDGSETIEELHDERVFLNTIEDEIQYVKKLKPGYNFDNQFEKLVHDTKSIMLTGIGLHEFSLVSKEAENLLQAQDDNKIIEYLQSRIKDFSLDELLEKILKFSSSYVTWQYEDEKRYYKELTGFEENTYIALFEYLWEKYKKEGYYIFDDAEIIYNDILHIDEQDNEVWNFNKIDEFGKIVEKLFLLSTKENLKEEFEARLYGDLIDPEHIYYNIVDQGIKDTFKKILDKLDYKWELKA